MTTIIAFSIAVNENSEYLFSENSNLRRELAAVRKWEKHLVVENQWLSS